MPETLGLIIAIVVLKVGILLCAVVPCQFEQALTVSLSSVLSPRVSEEVEVESGSFILSSLYERHSHDFLIELEGFFGIFDANHGMVLSNMSGNWSLGQGQPWAPESHHSVGIWISLLDGLSLLQRFLSNDFDPVAIRVQNKGNMLHPAISKLLLELVSGILETLASGLDVVHTNAGVAEATVRLFVAGVHGIIGVVLSAVVVSQLDNTFAVHVGVAVGNGLGTVVSHKVQIKLSLRKFIFLD